ncbi:hypothetical protein [uncultured Phocaeicola sp.]|uniref:hypothetical protein n=1 Tax=uncultured Phocaeicola sp. TaxID=990718 RepID=UPI0025857DD5|nr:hypothetical protein [uncultured Phocaeicola sp.]
MKLQSLPILSLLFFFTACSVREDTLWLQKAEQFYADKQIDSTLTYLNRIVPEELGGEDVYTYWRIQFSVAPQPFILHSSEKIEKLSQHYEKMKDTINLREINHIKYRQFLYNQVYDKADSMLQIIEKEAIVQQCPKELVRTYIYKTQFFKQIGRADSTLAYINKKMAIDTTHLHLKHYYREKAQTLLGLREFEVAKEMLDSAKAYATRDKDSEFAYSLAKEYTDLYVAQRQFSEALQSLQQSRRNMKRSDIPLHNMYKAHVYELMHQQDSAYYYYNLVSQSSNIFLASEAALRLSYLYEQSGSPEKAFRKHENAIAFLHNIYSAYNNQASASQFNELKLETEINALEIVRQRHINLILLLTFILSMIVTAFLYYLQYKKKEEMKRILQQESERLKQENKLLKQAEELSVLREKASMLREELLRKMEVFKKLPSLDNDTEEDKNSNRQISLTENEWREIRVVLDSNYDHFTTRLKQKFPTLSIADINFCCLIKINVSLHDMSNIYCISRNSVSKKKLRMKEKLGITSDEGISLDEYLQKY